jgi:hypothetical protein
MSIHDIHVDQIRPGVFNCEDFLTDSAEIGG